MPTIYRFGPYRFYFFCHDACEPEHVHVDRDNCSAKFWLKPVRFSYNVGFSPVELRKLNLLVIQHQRELLEKWYEYFGTGSR